MQKAGVARLQIKTVLYKTTNKATKQQRDSATEKNYRVTTIINVSSAGMDGFMLFPGTLKCHVCNIPIFIYFLANLANDTLPQIFPTEILYHKTTFRKLKSTLDYVTFYAK